MNEDEWHEARVLSLSLSLSVFFNRALLRVNARKASSSRIRFRVAFVVERVYVCVRVYVLYSVCFIGEMMICKRRQKSRKTKKTQERQEKKRRRKKSDPHKTASLSSSSFAFVFLKRGVVCALRAATEYLFSRKSGKCRRGEAQKMMTRKRRKPLKNA